MEHFNIYQNNNQSCYHIKIAITGTTIDETFEILLIPPTIIIKDKTVS